MVKVSKLYLTRFWTSLICVGALTSRSVQYRRLTNSENDSSCLFHLQCLHSPSFHLILNTLSVARTWGTDSNCCRVSLHLTSVFVLFLRDTGKNKKSAWIISSPTDKKANKICESVLWCIQSVCTFMLLDVLQMFLIVGGSYSDLFLLFFLSFFFLALPYSMHRTISKVHQICLDQIKLEYLHRITCDL